MNKFRSSCMICRQWSWDASLQCVSYEILWAFQIDCSHCSQWLSHRVPRPTITPTKEQRMPRLPRSLRRFCCWSSGREDGRIWWRMVTLMRCCEPKDGIDGPDQTFGFTKRSNVWLSDFEWRTLQIQAAGVRKHSQALTKWVILCDTHLFFGGELEVEQAHKFRILYNDFLKLFAHIFLLLSVRSSGMWWIGDCHDELYDDSWWLFTSVIEFGNHVNQVVGSCCCLPLVVGIHHPLSTWTLYSCWGRL